jgi:septal ring factor EnvC (AmiA/AmiB activator)
MSLNTLLIAAVSGGAATKLFEWVLDYAGLRSDAEAAFRDDLIRQIDKLQDETKRLRRRIRENEQDLAEERSARAREELRNEVMAQRIARLVQRLNELRRRLDMKPLDPEQFTDFDIETSAIETSADAP